MEAMPMATATTLAEDIMDTRVVTATTMTGRAVSDHEDQADTVA
jgi:hypothetical protein